jgi:hypothetical protein
MYNDSNVKLKTTLIALVVCIVIIIVCHVTNDSKVAIFRFSGQATLDACPENVTIPELNLKIKKGIIVFQNVFSKMMVCDIWLIRIYQ